jgi:hypothetical protein
MKTLRDHQILFDADCHMCGLYTNAFVKSGMLEKEGRIAYQDFFQKACPLLDKQRAANEIALINSKTGEVTYGIKSLFKVLGTAFPVINPLFTFKPFIWLMSKVYAFISYNRRVIIPAEHALDSPIQPTFKLHYRLLYLLFTWLGTALILSRYAILLSPSVPVRHEFREYFICGGQIIFQGFVIYFIANDKKWDYLGNMMTISFAGSLLLSPALLYSNYFDASPVYYTLWFLAVAGLMFLEHIR